MNKWSRLFEASRASAAPAGSSFAPVAHHYFAFLSYSHEDAATADWLHAELERFRVPSGLAGRLTANGVVPKRLSPIFRDRHELATGPDLDAEIRQALAASRCLIVLCSPAAARSKWTNSEIEEFKRAHPDGCVIAAIVSGEPFASEKRGGDKDECFPAALRQKYDRRGRPTGRRAEPLAADLRDNADGKRLGLLKIVAGILGVGLDDLVQRDHLRRQRRLAAITAGSLGGMLIASVLAVTAITARDEARDQRREAEGLVAFMLGDLKDKLQPLGRLDVLDAVGSRALSYYAKQDKSDLTVEALAQRAKALTMMGEIAQQRGDLAGALGRYREAMETTAELVRRQPDSGEKIFEHSQNVFWVGYIRFQRGQIDDAAKAFRLYKSLAERLVAIDPANKDWRLEPIYADNNLGIALLGQKKFSEASIVLQQMLASIEPLVASEPANRAYQDQHSEALAWLSLARESEGSLDEALRHRERQLALLQQQAAISAADAPMKLKMLGAHRAAGRLFAYRGDSRRGLAHLQESARLGDELVALEPGNSLWAERRAGSYLDLGNLQLALEQADAAAAAARIGCGTANRLVARDPSVVEWRVGLRSSCLDLSARLALSRGAAREAARLAAENLSVAQAQANQPPLADSRMHLAAALLLRGEVARANDDRNLAARSWQAALAAWPQGIELQPHQRATRALILEGLGRKREANEVAEGLAAMGFQHPGFARQRRLVTS